MTDREKLLAKIRALLSRDVASGASEAEAATALAMAQRLMDEHDLDAEQVHAGGGEQPGFANAVLWHGEARRPPIDGEFIGPILTNHFHVRVFCRSDGPPMTVAQVCAFGEPHHIEVACTVFHYLKAVFEDLWRRFRLDTGAGANQRRTFYLGLSAGFRSRLEEERKGDARREAQATRSAPSTALAVRESALAVRETRLTKAFEDVHGEIPIRHAHVSGDPISYLSGFLNGREISLAKPLEGQPTNDTPTQPRLTQGGFFE